jgi:hypothetical protein
MLRNEFAVCIHGVRATGVLPVLVLAKLRDARASLGRKLALRMPLNELAVPFDRVGRFRRPPILLFPAAPSEQ